MYARLNSFTYNKTNMVNTKQILSSRTSYDFASNFSAQNAMAVTSTVSGKLSCQSYKR
jgi:hypothetical protein